VLLIGEDSFVVVHCVKLLIYSKVSKD